MTELNFNYKEKLWELYEAVGQHFVDLTVSLIAMVVVARNFDLSGFGIFSYLVGMYHIASFISEAGICDLFKNRYALEKDSEIILKKCAGALFVTAIVTVLFFLITAFYNTSISNIEESAVAYILIGFAVPLRNGNYLRTTLLHVTGKHRQVSRILVKKHFVFLVLIWVIATIQIPSLLVGAFLISEIFFRFALRNYASIKGIFHTSFVKDGYRTIKESLHHVFSGEALNLIFHADLFILGLFVQSAQLGVYAGAALLGRFFLLIPVGIRPILHRFLAQNVAANDAIRFSKSVMVIRAYMFYIHALLALVLMVYFNDIFHFIFEMQGTEARSYSLFLIMLPGFLFYAAATVNESALEASGQAPFLSRLSAVLVSLNIILNFYFIPFAGVQGAAVSTLSCLLLYFFTLVIVKITDYSRVPLLEFLTGGGVVYLLQKLITWGDPPLYLFIIGVPPLLFLTFYLFGFFDTSKYQIAAESNGEKLI